VHDTTSYGYTGRAPLILKQGTRLRSVASISPRHSHTGGKNPWYSWNRRLSGSHSCYGLFLER
jgi:hypothetical protein